MVKEKAPLVISNIVRDGPFQIMWMPLDEKGCMHFHRYKAIKWSKVMKVSKEVSSSLASTFFSFRNGYKDRRSKIMHIIREHKRPIDSLRNTGQSSQSHLRWDQHKLFFFFFVLLFFSLLIRNICIFKRTKWTTWGKGPRGPSPKS